jgi:hypothetical protein
MSLKLDFVEREAKGESIAALCREYGVSRQTGHKWVKRFKEQGYEGLEERSRRPKSTPLATAEELVMPHWRRGRATPDGAPTSCACCCGDGTASRPRASGRFRASCCEQTRFVSVANGRPSASGRDPRGSSPRAPTTFGRWISRAAGARSTETDASH